MSTWFRRGFSGLDFLVQQSNTPQPFRVSPLPGEEKIFTILDNEPFCHHEHQLRIDGRPAWFTCLKQIGTVCPACERRNPSNFVALFTVIHTTVSEYGGLAVPKSYQNIFSASRYLTQLLREEHDVKGGLSGCKYRIRHSTDHVDSPRECLKSLGRVSLERYGPLKPFNYEQIFAPVSPKEMERLLHLADQDDQYDMDEKLSSKLGSFTRGSYEQNR